MIEVSELDKDVLELVALEVSWEMVCGEFYERFGSADLLAKRLFELRQGELLSITATDADGDILDYRQLVADALAHDCYEDSDLSRAPRWRIVATDKGFEHVRGRLSEQ